MKYIRLSIGECLLFMFLKYVLCLMVLFFWGGIIVQVGITFYLPATRFLASVLYMHMHFPVLEKVLPVFPSIAKTNMVKKYSYTDCIREKML